MSEPATQPDQATRHRALDLALRLVRHEVRNGLNIIQLNSHLLADRDGDQRMTASTLASVRQINRCVDILRELPLTTVCQDSRPTHCETAELLGDIAAACADLRLGNRLLVESEDAKSAELMIDRPRAVAAVRMLVRRAMDADQNRAIKLRAEPGAAGLELRLDCADHETEAGRPPDLFELVGATQQTSCSLDLAVAATLIRSLGGELTVERRTPAVVTLRIELPGPA